MAKNCGKIFEEDFSKSFPSEDFFVYRLRDNAASFGGGNNTRFASSNICDYIIWDDIRQKLYMTELKSTAQASIPYTMIKENQIAGLTSAAKYKIIPCFILNFREYNNATYFLAIQNFNKMKEKLPKKSFNISDLEKYGAIYIDSKKKRTRYRYNVCELFGKI